MHNFGKIQNEIGEHLRSFGLSDMHAFLLSGQLLTEVVMPVYYADLERSRAEVAACKRETIERCASAADGQYRSAAMLGHGHEARCALAIAAAIRALTPDDNS